jgi:hypothetical protein
LPALAANPLCQFGIRLETPLKLSTTLNFPLAAHCGIRPEFSARVPNVKLPKTIFPAKVESLD